MKRQDLYNYIREEIINELSLAEGSLEDKAALDAKKNAINKEIAALKKKLDEKRKQGPESQEANAKIAYNDLIKAINTDIKLKQEELKKLNLPQSTLAEFELEEMSRKAGAFTIGDTSKFAEAKDLYSAGLYADVLKAIEEAGDLGITQQDLGAKLGKGDGSSLNPILNKFKEVGVLGGGRLAAAEKPSKTAPKEKPEEPKFDIFSDEEDIIPKEKPQVATDKEIAKIAGDIDTSKSDEFNKVMDVIDTITNKLQKMNPGSKEYNNKITALTQYLANNKKILRGQDINKITKGLIGGGEI